MAYLSKFTPVTECVSEGGSEGSKLYYVTTDFARDFPIAYYSQVSPIKEWVGRESNVVPPWGTPGPTPRHISNIAHQCLATGTCSQSSQLQYFTISVSFISHSQGQCHYMDILETGIEYNTCWKVGNVIVIAVIGKSIVMYYQHMNVTIKSPSSSIMDS